jgi:hypothetical protein
MAERMMIARVKRTTATQAELYQARHKYPDLKLFDLAELATVGIDPATLLLGEETPARFWAVYELSAKLNKEGKPYKDVIALERGEAPATVTSAAVSDPAILAELRAIRALLQALAQAQGLQVPTPQEPEQENGNGDGAGNGGQDLDAAFPRFGDGATVPDAALDYYRAHLEATGQVPANLDALRAWTRANRANGKH